MEKYNYQFPWLTKEEFEFFKWKDVSFWKKYNVNWTIQRKIASALEELAVKKLLGYGGFEENKEEAIEHHLKACRYSPSLACSRPAFRREAGLLVYERCETNL